MMDIHQVCKRTNFDSLKVALLFGGFAFFSQLGVAGFLILILYFMMEIKYRVKKVQEILWILTQAEEKDEPDEDQDVGGEEGASQVSVV